MLTQNFSLTVKSFITKDDLYHFMSTITGTSAYCEKFFCGSSNIKTTRSPNILYDIKLCSFTLELISIIARLNGEDIDKKSINAMDLFQPCICLYLNRVLLTHHFKSRVEIIFKIIVTGKVKYLHSSFHIFICCCRLLMHQF